MTNSQEYSKLYYLKNKEKLKQNAFDWAKQNPEKVSLAKKKWRENNKNFERKLVNEWKLKNRHSVYATNAKRRGQLLNATPKWFNKHHNKQIKELFICAEMFTLFTGEKYHVDHIIPLCGKNINGLHVPWNLQVIPAKENLKKSNIFNSYFINN
jgi:hypothetical protein